MQNNADGTISSGSATLFALSEEGHLQIASGDILATNGANIILRAPSLQPGFGNGYPYVCTTSDGATTNNRPDEQEGDLIFCGADSGFGTYGSFYRCASKTIVGTLGACDEDDDTTKQEEILQLSIAYEDSPV